MSKVRRIRSELVADREHQPHYRSRMRREPFGIYRPLTADSKTHVRDVLLGAQEDIDKEVWWKSGTKFNIKRDLGVTFVRRSDIVKAMGQGSIRRGFDFEQMVRRIESEPVLHDERLDVPLDEMDWYGFGSSTLVAKLAPSEARMALENQSDALETILQGVSAELGSVDDPDHLSLYQFGARRDVHSRSHSLNTQQREQVAEIVQTHFDAARIGSITLGPIVVGDGYNRPRLEAVPAV